MRESPSRDLLQEEGAGYLISVSDVMAALLFIFMITLMAFVLSFQRQTEVRDRETSQAEAARAKAQSEANAAEAARAKAQSEADAAEAEWLKYARAADELTNSRRLRSQLLERIQEALRAHGIVVEVNPEHGILHLTEKAIHFPSAKAELPPSEERKLAVIAKALVDVVPCYATDPEPPEHCSASVASKLDAVFIEGHTDNMPYTGGRFQDNWDLSAQRAMYTYRKVAGELQPLLQRLRNADGFPVFGVSGYGEGRPRHVHAQPTADPANRRIDLRFIMSPPSPENAPVREIRERGL